MATQSKTPRAKAKLGARAQKPTKRKVVSRTKAMAKPKPQGKAAATKASDTKQSRLITMLRSEPGATIDQMVKLTGWQPHTVRAVISSALRKRLGLNVAASSGEGRSRVYRIVGTPAP